MKKILLFIFSFVLFSQLSAQKYLTQTGTIRFFSKTPVEDIEAFNNQVSGVLNTDNGEMAFTLLMKAFTFEKALMQEHFNEKYIESHKFPKSTFKGKILDFNKSSLTDKTREVMIRGTLTIHGISKEISVKGTLEKTKGGISGRSVFNINIKDYNIKVPSAVRKNIADTIEINVNMNYEKMD
jgi:polyisoprenoid-binding protein YceI